MTLEVVPRRVDLASALDAHAAAEWLLRERGIERKATTLAKLRSQGGGPSFYRIDGSVRYLVPDLDAYAKSLICGPLRTSREVAITQSNNEQIAAHNAAAPPAEEQINMAAAKEMPATSGLGRAGDSTGKDHVSKPGAPCKGRDLVG
jgi:hypothetical protein